MAPQLVVETTDSNPPPNPARRGEDRLARAHVANIAHLAVDRHARGPRGKHTALRWLAADQRLVEFTYADLHAVTNQFAHVLTDLGATKEDRVFSLAGRIPDVHIAALGSMKRLCIFSALFSSFGPEPIFQRLRKGDGRFLVTTQRQYERKVAGLRDRLPDLQYVLLTDVNEDLSTDVLSLPRRMGQAPTEFAVPPTSPEDLAFLHFTSGTTGTPKGAVHAHNAAVIHYLTGRAVLDFMPRDVFWCTADPGWVTGIAYGLIAPLLHGITNVLVEAEFDVERWYGVLEDQQVSIWYTAPTAIRRLMRADRRPRQRYDLARLRHIFSVGEPLNPEAIAWARRSLGRPIRDTWWQTETGGIMIANAPPAPVQDGAMGKPLRGIDAAIVERRPDGSVKVFEEADVVGELAIRTPWPSMFQTYLHEQETYDACFADGWYLTGDRARRDGAGYFWFVGRSDDIIKTSGCLVGPFEVENVLMEHAAVLEAGVVGKPDPFVGELVKAYVALKPGVAPTETIKMAILAHARRRLGPTIAPRQIEFHAELPKTSSGKIMRRFLREMEVQAAEDRVTRMSAEH
jgi:acetyl-CoA synthetase